MTVTAFVHLTEGGVHGTTRADLFYAITLAAVPGGLGHLAMTWPLKRVPANLPPVIKLPTPFVAGLMTWALLGEAMTWMHLLGGVVTLGGALGAIRSIDMMVGGAPVQLEAAASLE
jgi:drug/metabolite transporter (DMT)-like permease